LPSKRFPILLSVLGLPLIIAGCAWNFAPGKALDGSLVSGGLTRTYHLFIPPSYGPGRPSALVLVLHGGGGSGKGMNALTHFNRIAAREGFLVVYPDGVNGNWADGRAFTPPDLAGVDDVRFLSDLISALSSAYSIDPDRVYVTGISNGGFMTQRMGCALADRIAAIAPVAAGLPENLQGSCSPSRPLPVIEFAGTSDPLVPYAGGTVGPGNRGQTLAAAGTIAFWAAQAGCQTQPSITDLPDASPTDGTRVQWTAFRGCAPSTDVFLYTIVGGGHTWPGGWQYLPVALVGRTSRDIDASELIWAFFKAHPRQNR